MMFSNVLIRSYDELAKTDLYIRHALVEETKSNEKGTYPIVYQYLGKRRLYSSSHTIQKDSIIGTMTNIHQDEISGDILCDVTIYDVKNNSSNFNFKIDNIVICVSEGKEKIVNGVIYNPYAKSVIDEKRRIGGSSKYVEKTESSPIPDVMVTDKPQNPLFDPNVKESIDNSLKDFLRGGDTTDVQ